MPIIMEAKPFVDKRIEELKSVVQKMSITPVLYIFTGPGEENQVYAKSKVKKGKEIGIEVKVVPTEKMIDFMFSLEDNFYPFIIQKPSILSTEEEEFILNSYRGRDMDGFGSDNLGRLFKGLNCVQPCTPKGIIQLLEFYGHNLEGKNIVVIGRSDIVGKPLSVMLGQHNANVTLCHSKTPHERLIGYCEQSDIIISAAGKKDVLKRWKAKPSQILIDVGINKNDEGKLCGDFSQETVENSYAYSPVPGGCGLMTVISLMENVVNYYKKFILD